LKADLEFVIPWVTLSEGSPMGGETKRKNRKGAKDATEKV